MTAIATQTINLDLRPHYNRQNNCIVYCSQYDNDLRNVVVNIADAGTAVNVSTYTIYIEGTKPDKKGFSYELTDIGGTVSNNVVTFPLQLQMTACAGITNAELVFYSGDDRIGSSNFILAVEKAGLADDIDVSETDIPAYVDGAQQAAQAAEDAKDAAVDAKDTAVAVAASIPEDYTTLSNDVDDLMSALVKCLKDVVYGTPNGSVYYNKLKALNDGYKFYDYLAYVGPTAQSNRGILITNLNVLKEYIFQTTIFHSNTIVASFVPVIATSYNGKSLGMYVKPSNTQLGYWYNGTDSATQVLGITANQKHLVEFKPVGMSDAYPNNATISVDGVEFNTQSTASGGVWFTFLGMFANAASATSTQGINNLIGQRIGETIIKSKGGDIIYDLVPAFDGTHYGFLELKEYKFFYNADHSDYTGGNW